MGTRILFVTALVMGLTQTLLAETTAMQSFVVTVPPTIHVVAPVETVVTGPAEANAVTGARVFAAQLWTVVANTPAGATVQYAVDEPFTHDSDPSIQADVALSIAVVTQNGPASWNVTQASDTTSHRSGDDAAMVQVTADNAGTAQIGLSVTFAPSSPDAVAVGTYTASVVCTIAAPL